MGFGISKTGWSWQVDLGKLLNLTGFYISIALTRAYATCHSERSEESQTRNGTKSGTGQNPVLRPDASPSTSLRAKGFFRSA